MGLLDRFTRRPDRQLPAYPRASGQARTVQAVHDAIGRGHVHRFLPCEGLPHLGDLLDVEALGPARFRPGEVPTPSAHAMRGITELAYLRAGEIDHRDSLGHRDTTAAPAVRGVAAGAGVLSEAGPSRRIQRDGGEVQLLYVRWAQSDATTPTVRVMRPVQGLAQGRSTVTPLAGPGAPVRWPEERSATHVRVAAGATVDLDLVPALRYVVCVLAGTALIGGQELVALQAPVLAVLGPGGPRLQVATRLEPEVGAELLVLTAPTRQAGLARDDMLLAEDAEGLDTARQALRDGAFGQLPRH